MGVSSLWKVLEPIKKSKSLLLLATEHHKRARSTGVRGENATMRLGVDMGTWMAECNAGALAAGVNSQQAGGGLRLFFNRLIDLLKIPAFFIFVFDGHARPPVKRGRRVQHWRAIWWADLSVKLIEAFGYKVHDAPAEAEAELAKLNTLGHIHGIITSDSDGCLFGTPMLLRSIPKKDRSFLDEHMLYEVTTTEHPSTGYPLTQGDLVLFALLCGGDYVEGIHGCGPTTAFGVIRHGFGDQLIEAYSKLDDLEFEEFLELWRSGVEDQILETRPSVALLPDNFPDRRVLDLYINPLTSWSPGWTPPNPAQWRLNQPCIPDIARFCSQHFRWEDPYIIKSKFKEGLWEGVCLQMVYSPSIRYIPEHRRLQLPGSQLYTDILKVSHQKRRGQFVHMFGNEPQPRLLVSTSKLIDLMGPTFNGTKMDKITIWPPASLLAQACQEDEEIPQASSSSTIVESAGIKLEEEHLFIDLTND